MIIFIHQSAINLVYPHVLFIRNKYAQSWKKGRQSKRAHVSTHVSQNREIYIFSKEKFFINWEDLLVKELDMILTYP